MHKEVGSISIQITGKDAYKLFKNESGRHVVQRVPSNGKGKRHTSIVVVGVLPIPPDNSYIPLPESELRIIAQCGKQGAGGQNVNKVASACRITHIPTGIAVFINGRDFHKNKKTALEIINFRVNERRLQGQNQQYSDLRKSVLGKSCRGDKIRTYNFIESRAVDHRFNIKTGNIKAIMRGDIELLYPKEDIKMDPKKAHLSFERCKELSKNETLMTDIEKEHLYSLCDWCLEYVLGGTAPSIPQPKIN